MWKVIESSKLTKTDCYKPFWLVSSCVVLRRGSLALSELLESASVSDGACSEVHADDNDDPGVGDDDGGRGDTDRLGGPRINPPRFPMS